MHLYCLANLLIFFPLRTLEAVGIKNMALKPSTFCNAGWNTQSRSFPSSLEQTFKLINAFNHSKLSVVQKTRDNHSKHKKSQCAPERPSNHSLSLLPVFWTQPDSCFLILPVLHLSFLTKHSARTMQPWLKKKPGGQTGRQMEMLLLEIISQKFLPSTRRFTNNCSSRGFFFFLLCRYASENINK